MRLPRLPFCIRASGSRHIARRHNVPWRAVDQKGQRLFVVIVVITALLAGTLAASSPPAPASGNGGLLDPLAGPASASATTLDCGAVSSSILGRSVDYCVALPADYNSSAPARYPERYYLHCVLEAERRRGERGAQA